MPHIHELYDYVITVFIVHNDKVLLVNHPRYNKWIPMGGHIELDEDPEQAIYREVAEETGLNVELLTSRPRVEDEGTKFLPTPNYLDVHEANSPHKHIAFVYFATSENDRAILSNEHTDLRWFTPEELKDRKFKLTPSVIFYGEQAIKMAVR